MGSSKNVHILDIWIPVGSSQEAGTYTVFLHGEILTFGKEMVPNIFHDFLFNLGAHPGMLEF